MTVQELGIRIRNYRISSGLTQAALAERLMLAPQTVSKWERGLSSPDITYLSALCSTLGITPSKLIEENEDKKGAYMIAIDGGGSKTELVLFDTDGCVIEKLSTNGSNPNLVGMQSAAKTIREAIDKLLCSHSEIERIYAGISGAASGANGTALFEMLKKRYPAYKITVESDIMNIIGLSEKNDKCTAAIMGTGVVTYGWDGESLHRLGGFGSLFDAAGSGYAIGRDIIALALAAENGLAERGEAVRLVEAKLGTKPFASIDLLYKNGNDYIASFAPLAFAAMEVGDRDAEKIVRKSTEYLASLILKAIEKYDVGNSVILGGGIATCVPAVQKLLREAIPEYITLEFSELPPIFGAMRRCLDLSRTDYNFKVLKENFINTYK